MTQKKQTISSSIPFKVLTPPIYKKSATAFCDDEGTYIPRKLLLVSASIIMVVLLFLRATCYIPGTNNAASQRRS